jgi:hypothetical protein
MEKICVEKIGKMDSGSDYDYATFLKSKVWPRGVTLGIFFMNSPQDGGVELLRCNPGEDCDPLQTRYENLKNLDIKQAIVEIVKTRIEPLLELPYTDSQGRKVSGLYLNFVDKIEDSTIRINFDQTKGSWSQVGTDARSTPRDQPTLNLGWFNVRTILHEFGHVLGMVHEHQNPRGNTIDWDVPKLDAYMQRTQGWNSAQVNDQIVKRYSVDQTNGSSFDKKSIMVYFYPSNLTLNNEGMKQNHRLSETDIEYIKKMYGFGSADSEIVLTPDPSSSNWTITIIFSVLLVILVIISIALTR